MTESAIIAVQPADGDRPSITYRPSGDRYVLMEYGEDVLDLWLNFVVLTVLGWLREQPPPGFVEAAPGLRSVLIHHDPSVADRSALIEDLWALHERAPDRLVDAAIPSRLITLPIAFDDSMCAKAVRHYAATSRIDAPNITDDSNIDYIVRSNGLGDPEELYSSILSTEWWSAFTGFMPGLPFLLPLDPRHELSAPKYNPTRSWTAEGTVGIGGPCVAIYPVESPGSYQLFGRTVPIYDVLGCHHAFVEDSNLIRAGDRVRFTRVDEDELLALRREVFEDRYPYRIDDAPFAVADYLSARARGANRAHEADRASGTEVP